MGLSRVSRVVLRSQTRVGACLYSYLRIYFACRWDVHTLLLIIKNYER